MARDREGPGEGRVGEPDDDLHNIPAWEDEQHVESPDCYCCPRLEAERHVDGQRLYVHYAREEAH